MKLAQTLDFIMTTKNLTAYKISKDTGISDRLIGYWRKGDKLPGAENLLTLANYFGISVDYLLTGKQNNSSIDVLSNDEQRLLTYFRELSEVDKGVIIGESRLLSGAVKKTSKKPKNTIYIETYSLPVSAGTGVYLDNCEREMIRVQETALTHEANFALRVSGDSMEPDYHDGDTLLIRSQPTVELGEVGIFILDGEGYVKEFGGNCLISHNPKYKNIKLNEYSEIYCRGLVIGVLDNDDFV